MTRDAGAVDVLEMLRVAARSAILLGPESLDPFQERGTATH